MIRVANPEPNDTDRTFPRSIDEVQKRDPEWRGLNAEEANPISGPWDDHGLKSMEHYKEVAAWLALSLWADFMVLCTIIIIHWME
jgi:hypothetical protein